MSDGRPPWWSRRCDASAKSVSCAREAASFDVLNGSLSAERTDVSIVGLGKELGVPTAVVKRQIHHLRQRYRALLRREVARTVGTDAEVEDEIRYLCAAVLLRLAPAASHPTSDRGR